MPRALARRLLQRVGLWLATLSANRRKVHGITVLIASGESRNDEEYYAEAESKLREALGLIQAVDPRRHLRITRDVQRILILSAGGPEYIPRLKCIVLNGPYIATRSLERLAMDIVHEGCHARLAQRGVRLGTHNAGRIEHRCVKEEVLFARRLPNSFDIVATTMKKLDTKWWEPNNVLERRERDLKTLGASTVFIRIWRWMAK